MARRNIHANPFDEGTVEKLELYREYLRAWLPTFIHWPKTSRLQVFDLFAGPGFDPAGKPGSPVVALEEVRLALGSKKTDARPGIALYFNERDTEKADELSRVCATGEFDLPGLRVSISANEFDMAFRGLLPKMRAPGAANLVFLDQYGVRHVSQEVLQSLARLPCTDFLFFVSSAMVNRFREQPEIRDRVPITDADVGKMNGTNVHRILANAYARWLPDPGRYFIAPFSIKKGANVYGLVFGSGHPLGMDKFLQVAWKHGGDANFDIDGDGIDPNAPALFAEFDRPTKVKEFEKNLEAELMGRRLADNKAVYEYALRNGMLASHAKDALGRMVAVGRLPKQTFKISYDAWKKPAIPLVYERGT